VSVIIPTFNRRNVLEGSINSVLTQTLKPIEIVIVDDCSTDGTSDWLAEAYPELTLITLPRNSGAAHARNIGMDTARGEFIAFLDSDDRWHSEHLEKSVSALMRAPNAVMAASDVLVVLDKTGQRYVHNSQPSPGYRDLVHHLLLKNFITTMSSVVVRKNVILRAGYLDERFSVVHDREWYIRLARFGDIISVGAVSVTRTIQDDGLVSDLQQYQEDIFFFLQDSPENQAYLDARDASYLKMLLWFAGQEKQRGRFSKALVLYGRGIFHAGSLNVIACQIVPEMVMLLKLYLSQRVRTIIGQTRK
jgi:glycosyltransferase involved in cell wall biosynthesis